jgi:CRISPR-associated protein Csm4
MHILRFTIQPRAAFGTPLVGDTLFGQLCWAFRHRFGNAWLGERLQGYCNGHPFMVISDAFPQGFLPLPTVPSRLFESSTEDHKMLKKKRWLPVAEFEADFRTWQSRASTDREAADTVFHEQGKGLDNPALQKVMPQSHNSINRETGTTGEGMFAPYSMSQIWFHPAMCFDLYAVIDKQRISAEELTAALADTGQSGYGRDASIGLGKFIIASISSATALPKITNANAWLTLAACAPQGMGFDRERSFYRPVTRFGRHGNTMALSGNPFKRPVLLAATGSVFAPANGGLEDGCLYIGQGLKGVSTVQPEAVSQGYAPVLGIHMEVSR